MTLATLNLDMPIRHIGIDYTTDPPTVTITFDVTGEASNLFCTLTAHAEVAIALAASWKPLV